MRKHWIIGFPIGLIALIMSSLAFAEGEKTRQHDKHVHGGGELKMAAVGTELQMEFDIPGMGIVGFEHEARTDEQKAAVAKALDLFKGVSEIVSFPSSANCKATLVTASNEEHHEEGHGDEHHEEGHGDEHHDEGKEEHHDDEHHDEGKEEHHDDEHHDKDGDHEGEVHHEGEEESHSEFKVVYHFECGSPDNLKQVTVNLFTHFSGVQELDAQIITASRQFAKELTADDRMIPLK